MSFADTDTGTGFGVSGTSAAADGLLGQSDTGRGVDGNSRRGTGVLGTSGQGTGVDGQSDKGVGVRGSSSVAEGVVGSSKRSDGVRGRATDKNGAGVLGTHDVSGNGVAGMSKGGNGVFGQGDVGPEQGVGVFGLANPRGYGVYGYSPQGPAGVVGICEGGFGVFGHTNSDAAAVFGENSAHGVGVEGHCNLGDGVVGMSDQGAGVVGHGDTGVVAQGKLTGLHATGTFAIRAEGDYAGVIATANGVAVSGDGKIAGVQGNSGAIGVNGVGGLSGVAGTLNGRSFMGCVTGMGTSTNQGVLGASEEGSGIHGVSVNGSAVVGTSPYPKNRGPYGFAGNFQGAVNVTGPVHKSGGGFKIDHPLAPTTMFLNHSFVESPDMKNIYDGVVVLDATGSATVTLPEWFEALNRDVRYQLTPIGGAAPDLHVAAELRRGAFKIGGGKARMKVSWQVTGIRKDPWANANRIRPEERKLAIERGRYRHPEVYGKPEDMSIAWAVMPQLFEAIKRYRSGRQFAPACRKFVRETAALLRDTAAEAHEPSPAASRQGRSRTTASATRKAIASVKSVLKRLPSRNRAR